MFLVISVRHDHGYFTSFLMAQTVKNLPAMQETQVQSLGREDCLEKGMATHCSILAWRTPWTEGPGGLQSMGVTETPGKICVCSVMPRASAGTTQMARVTPEGQNDVETLQSHIWYPVCNDSDWHQWQTWVQMWPLMSWAPSWHGNLRVVSGGSEIQEQVFQQTR